MRKSIVLVLMAMFASLGGFAAAQETPSYYNQYDFLMAPSSAYYEGLLGFANPAVLSFLHKTESRFYWSTEGTKAGSFNNWGLFIGFPNLGFGMLRQNHDGFKTTDYRLSIAGGNKDVSLGFAYSWSKINIDSLEREKLFKSAIIVRPVKYLSLGLAGDFSFESSARQGIAEIGLRPLGNPRLTLFADAAMQKKTRFSEAPWSAGAIVELIPGLHMIGRYFENESFTVGLNINFGKDGAASQVHFDADQEHSYNSYSVRLGGMRPSVFPMLIDKEKRYLKLSLKGSVRYHRYQWFDKDTKRFMDILKDIRAAEADPRVAAIALNLSSMRISPELAWEIREALKSAQKKGKTVIVYLDYVGMTDYHLASVADKIILDPEGFMLLFGYAASRTYFKGTLEKLGLGFDEWRFFKYKSAVEAFSRENMSEADREQYQDFVDDLYETTRTEVCQSRSLDQQRFDSLIDNQVVFVPEQAVSLGLVDTLARWSDIDKILKNLTGKSLRGISSNDLYANALTSEQWGEPDVIAVVYGLGECAMDSGIKARWLERVFLNLKKDRSVKAVVFRVDSPGGEALASDLVAEALKKCAEKKPVIVSQGQVAGSGGYWISMYGDKILAGPSTITGSIGVIGGWLYDKEFGSKLGMTSDYVARGKHADLNTGVRLPFLGMTVPSRNVTDDERIMIEKVIREFYEVFVEKVAAGRQMTIDEVKKVGEGHFYSGLDGKAAGLIDEIGGLMLAIEIARQEAGIEPEQEINIREIPKYKGLFKISKPFSAIRTELEDEPALKYIKLLNENRGRPLPMLIPGTYPESE